MEEEDLMLILLLMQTWYMFSLMVYDALRQRQGRRLKTYLMRSYAKPKRFRHQPQVLAAQPLAIFETNTSYNDEDVENENTQNNGRINEYLDHPVRGLTIPQRIFNYRLSRARRVIENAFGILVSKWNILKTCICCKVETVESIVMALICLHNFLLDSEKDILPTRRLYENPGLVDRYGPHGEVQNGEWRAQVPQHGILERAGRLGANNPTRAAIIQRDKLRDYFLTQEGEILWQYMIKY